MFEDRLLFTDYLLAALYGHLGWGAGRLTIALSFALDHNKPKKKEKVGVDLYDLESVY